MTKPPPERFRFVVAQLCKARDAGMLGVIAASADVPEYRLHDFAKYKGNCPQLAPYLDKKQMERVYKYLIERGNADGTPSVDLADAERPDDPGDSK